MNAEQKERALTALGMWHSSNDGSQREYQSAELMVALLQELVDAPEPEPVATATGYYAGYLSIATIDGRVLPAGTALYLAPPAPSVPDGWIRAVDEAMVVHHIGIADRADSYEVAKKKLNALLVINSDIARYFSEPPADVARDAKPDIWRVMCGDWRDKTVAIHNSAGYITCGLDPAKAAVLVRAHNGEMSDGGAAIAEVKGQS